MALHNVTANEADGMEIARACEGGKKEKRKNEDGRMEGQYRAHESTHAAENTEGLCQCRKCNFPSVSFQQVGGIFQHSLTCPLLLISMFFATFRGRGDANGSTFWSTLSDPK